MTETTRSTISRRRLLAGAGAGTAAVWAAPAITTLASASAAGSCARGRSVFRFVAADVTSPTPPGEGLTGTFTTGTGSLTVTGGNVDYVGPGTPFVPPTYPGTVSIDLTGNSSATITVLSGPSLGTAAYFVELDVFGSIPGEVGGNRAVVTIGATPVIDTGNIGDTTASAHAFSGSSLSAGGTLTLTHTGTNDSRGLFLNRLEVFTCL